VRNQAPWEGPVRRLLVLVVAAGLTVGLTVAASGAAGAAHPNNCDLLTKKQTTKFLGYKVVATKLTREKSTGAEQCEWRTDHYFGSKFKSLGAPYKLKVTTQPLTADVEQSIKTLESDIETSSAPELGDRVRFDKYHNLIAVVGPVVLQIEAANYTTEGGGSIDKIVVGPETAAAKLLIPLFEQSTKN